jgi:hypothetical protein
MKVVRSSASRTVRPYPQEMFLVFIFTSGCVDPRAHGSVGSHGKNSPVTPQGIDPGTVRLVAQRLNHYATPGPNVHSSDHVKGTIRSRTDAFECRQIIFADRE